MRIKYYFSIFFVSENVHPKFFTLSPKTIDWSKMIFKGEDLILSRRVHTVGYLSFNSQFLL